MSASHDDVAERPARSRKRAAAPPPQSDSEAPAATPPAAEPDQEPASGGAGDAVAASPALARADAMLDQAGQRVGEAMVEIGHRLRVWSARAREEAEDIWAEAQSRRHQE